MSITLSLTDYTTTSDETPLLQDNDILLAELLTRYLDGATGVKAVLESASVFSVDLDTAAEAGYRVALTDYTGGNNQGEDILTVSDPDGGVVTGLAFTDASGDLLDGYSDPLNEIFISTGEQIFLYTVPTQDNIVLGRLGMDNPAYVDQDNTPLEPEYIADASGDVVFALLLQETLTSGQISGAKIWTITNSNYTFLHPDTTDFDDSIDLDGLVYVSGSAEQAFDLSTLASGQNNWNAFGDADDQIIVISDEWAAQTVNTSKGGGDTTIGNSNQLLDGIDLLKDVNGESMVFTFAKNSPDLIDDLRDPASTMDFGDAATIDYDSLSTTTGVTWNISQTQGGDPFAVATMTALFTEDDEKASSGGDSFTDGLVGDDMVVDITSVKVFDKNGGVLIDVARDESNPLPQIFTESRTVGKGGNAETFDLEVTFHTNGTATVSGLIAKDSVASTTAEPINRWMLTNTGADEATLDWDIGGFSLLDTSIARLEVGSKVIFDDDGPVNLGGEGPDPLVVDDSDLTPTDTDSGSFAGQFSFLPGEDGTGATTTYALSIPALGEGETNIFSGILDTFTGNKIYLFLEGGAVVGKVGLDADGGADPTGAIAFTIDVNTSTALVTLTQNRAVLHDNSSDPVETGPEAEKFSDANRVGLRGTITDKDGDSYAETVNIGLLFQFEDDGPTVGTATNATVDDDTLGTDDDGNSLAITFGADGAASSGAATFDQTATNAAAMTGLTYTYNAAGTVLTAKEGATTIFTVTLNQNGTYDVDQVAAYTHPGTDDGDVQAMGTFSYIATDGDTDTASGTFKVTVNDSIPTVGTATNATVDDDTLGTDDDGNSLAITFGADGAASSGAATFDQTATNAAAMTGLTYTYNAAGTVLTAKEGATTIFTVTLNQNGTYDVDQVAAYTHPGTDDGDVQAMGTFSYIATDGDTDTASGTFKVTVNDSIPTVGTATNATVDDDTLGTDDDGNSLAITFGADGAASSGAATFDQTATNAAAMTGLTYTYNAAGTVLTAKEGATTIFTVTLNQNGTYDVDQVAAYTHPGTDDGDVQAMGTFSYIATDGDTDTASGTFKVTVNDSIPTVGTATNATVDDDTLGTDDDGNSLAITFGADGAASSGAATFDQTATNAAAMTGLTYTYNAAGTVLTAKEGATTIFTVTLNQNGTYDVDQVAAYTHPGTDDGDVQAMGTFSYIATDGDTDTASGTFKVTVNDSIPTVGTATNATVDDDTLGTDDDGNSLAITFGADGAASSGAATFDQTATNAAAMTGLTYTYNAAGTVLTAKEGATTIFTVTLNQNGTYDVDQVAAYTHPGTDDGDVQAMGTFSYIATDGDTDTASGTFKVTVNDSIPTVGTATNATVDDDTLGTDDDGNSLAITFGADGAASSGAATFDQTATNAAAMTGLTYTYNAAGTVLTAKEGATTIFTVTLNQNGTYDVDQVAAYTHPGTDDGDVQAMGTFSYIATDGDTDTASGTFKVTVNDSIPTVGTATNATVDDDTLGTDDDGNSLAITFGADGAASSGAATFDQTATNAAAMTGLTYTYNAAGTVLTAKEGATTIFTVTLNQNGTYDVDQVAAYTHPGTDDGDVQAMGTFSYIATDGDTDTASGTFKVTVNDSIPTVGTATNATVDDDTLGTDDDGNSLAITFGADGAASSGAATFDQTATNAAAMTGLTYTYNAAGTVLTAKEGATTIFTVTLNQNGTYDVDQVAAYTHPGTDDGDVQAMGTFSYIATDGDTDTASGTFKVTVNDSVPTLGFGNLIGSGSENPQIGFWSESVGADQPGSLTVTPNASFDLGNGTSGTVENWSWNGSSGTGTLTADFDSDAGTADTSVDFTLTTNSDGTYVFNLAEGFGSSTTFSTDGGQLPAGGPDPVQTLIAIGDIPIVFFALDPTTANASGAVTQLAPAVALGAPDLTEAQLQEMSAMADWDGLGTPGLGTFPFIADRFEMNVSGTGIGVGNNVLQGNASLDIDLDDSGPDEDKDESFVVNPEPLLTEVEVFVSKTAGNFAPPGAGATAAKTDWLYYNIIDAAGGNSGPTLVNFADVTDNGDLWSFKIQWDGSSLIDALQLTMAFGDIKMPEIQFTSGSTQLASDIFLDFTAILTDKDSDTANSSFAIDLYADDADLAGSSYTLVDAGTGDDAFNVDLTQPVPTYTLQGFTQGSDQVVLLNPTVDYSLNSNVITANGATITVEGVTTLTDADVQLAVNDQLIDGNFIVAGSGSGSDDSDAWIGTLNPNMTDTGSVADFLIVNNTTDLGTVTGFESGEDGIVVYATTGDFADAVAAGDLAAGELGGFVDGSGVAGFVYDDAAGELSFWDGDITLSTIADVGPGLMASDIDIIV